MILVYVVQAGIGGPIKIGITGDIFTRIETIQVANASEIKVLALFEGSRDQEEELHRRFDGDWIRGEWFHPSSSLLEFIESCPKDLLSALSFERQRCGCGRASTSRRLKDGRTIYRCRRCLMADDGRLDRLIASNKAPKPKAAPRACKRCQRLVKIQRYGRCGACSEYLRKHGVERPDHFFSRVFGPNNRYGQRSV